MVLVRVRILFSPSPDFIDVVQVRVRILSMLNSGLVPGPDFIHYESGFCCCPALDFILFESGSGIYQASPGPDVIHSGSGSGLCQACPGPRPDFTNAFEKLVVFLEKTERQASLNPKSI